MGIMDKYLDDKKRIDEAREAHMTYVTPDPAMTPMFNQAVLYKTISDRDTMTDTELRAFIQYNFLSIINNVFGRVSVKEKYVDAFRDARFLDCFNAVICSMPMMDPGSIIKCNIVAYHYVTMSDTNIDKRPEIVNRMLTMASIINRNKAVALARFNLPSNFQTLILMARHSDFNLQVCIKRVNLIFLANHQEVANFLRIENLDDIPSQYAIETMSNLLWELYSTENWEIILTYFMMDTLPDNDGSLGTEWITPEVEAIDSILQLAMLYILEHMITGYNNIYTIIRNYSEGFRMYSNAKPRFSMQNIASEDYPRLCTIVQNLRDNERINVP